ncbi:hypothetical protein OH76DRAFT_1354108 [Lentinus brumalis]|uniref:Integrase core domain-containing protein n=1 Tax=Lentinus brumalis TaxID=2498619 RepID=A0A371D4W2_9APHY|nr:hypothetical protein OH76DRAFT_1354108 [Polyporus brumalis]
MGLSDKKIAENCKTHYDTEKYGLSATTVKRVRAQWGLTKTRKQAHTLDSIHAAILEIKETYPQRGAGTIQQALRLRYDIFAPKDLVLKWLRIHEPEAVQARKHQKFKRRRFWTAGLNDFWAMDQHDKWGARFGLYLHLGTEPTAGEVKWLKIWWTNSNPRLVSSYYFEAVRKLGAIPLVTQSDPGSENFGVANAHTTLRHLLDPSLSGTLQHRWMRKHMNIKPEILWSVLNQDWKPGFESILQFGVDQGWYDPADPVEGLLFKWLAIPWLQTELDMWAAQYNMTPRRAQRNKTLPQGIPVVIARNPQQYGVHDFKIQVSVDLIDQVAKEWAPSGHPVFDLVPPAFQKCMEEIFDEIGRPVISAKNFWIVYLSLFERFLLYRQQHPQSEEELQEAITLRTNLEDASKTDDAIEILPGLRPLRQGDIFQGNSALAVPQNVHPVADDGGEVVAFANFTSDEEDGDDDDAGFL